jgi:hypothetical protein
MRQRYTEFGMDTRDEQAPETKVAEQVGHLGEELRMTRLRRRLSQGEVARRARTSPARVSGIETGGEMIRIDTLAKIANALGLRVTLEPAA